MRTYLLFVPLVSACTNFIVTKGASLEGHNSFGYTDDGGNNYGEITLLPAADHPAGSTRKIWRWEDGKYLGEIPEVAHTYHVVGNMNEHQLAIGETTFTGRTELRNPMEIAKMDYANLMSISLQRAKTARQALAKSKWNSSLVPAVQYDEVVLCRAPSPSLGVRVHAAGTAVAPAYTGMRAECDVSSTPYHETPPTCAGRSARITATKCQPVCCVATGRSLRYSLPSTVHAVGRAR